MKPITLFVCVALASCGPKASRPKPDALTIPGLRWVTGAQPWHLPHPTFSFAADGDVAILGSRDGWLSRIDLRTGHVVTSRQIGALTIDGLAPLGGGRWVAVGLRDDRVVGFVVDGGTLATTPIALAEYSGSFRAPKVARLADGGLVITSPAMPLAIYDPKTWKVRTMVADEVGWEQMKVRGNVIGAYHEGKAYRFDVTSSRRTELGESLWFDVSATLSATSHSMDLPAGREDQLITIVGAERQASVLPDPVFAFAFDDAGTRLVTTHVGQVWIHDLPSGVVKARVDLGDGGDDWPYLALTEGDRAFVIMHDVLRVVDLETGTVTLGGEPIWGATSELAVADDGTVSVLGTSQLWQLENAEVTRTTPFEGEAFWLQADDPSHFLVAVPGRLERRDADGAVIQSWSVEDEVGRGWSGSDGWIAELQDPAAGWRGPYSMSRGRGAQVEALFPIEPFRMVDADPDRGLLMVNSVSVMHVLDADDPAAVHPQLPIPTCADNFQGGNLERRGDRAATWSERAVAIWDRPTSTLLGSARFDDVIIDVAYLHDRDEVIVSVHDHLVLWTPSGEARVLAVPGYVEGQISADGHQLALGFHDGRVALVELDALRAGTTPTSLPTADVPSSCPTGDPLHIEPREPDFVVPPPEPVWHADGR